jgi:MFS transporter, FLVCR family, MFS-domain-containing protein 7
MLGLMNTLGTIIGVMTAAEDYGPSDASLFGAVFITGGIFGSAAFGIYVELTKKYKQATIIICGMTSVTSVLLLLSLASHIVWAASLCCFCVGFFSVAIIPVGIDFGVEITHPTPEPISSGLLMSAGNVAGIVFVILASESIHYFEERDKNYLGCNIAQGFLIISAAIAFIASFFI